jgi:hypothetical protein
MGVGKVVRYPIQTDDLIEILKWGAGGYGDPLDRDPNSVLEDVGEGRVSPEHAADIYGVEIADGTVDVTASKRRRAEMRDRRTVLSIAAVSTDTVDGDTRLWLIAPSVAARLGVENGDVVECLAAAPAPLRGRVAIRAEQQPTVLPAGPFAIACLRVGSGSSVEIRPVINLLLRELP